MEPQLKNKHSQSLSHMLAIDKRPWFDAAALVIAVTLTYMSVSSFAPELEIYQLIFKPGSETLSFAIITLAISFFYVLVFAIRRLNELGTKIEQANTDSLVGIFNRRKGTELLIEAIHKANLHHIPLSVIMLDIDNFKDINDKFGHDAGDEVLKGVIELVQSCSRHSDILIRWGGEEFIVGCSGTSIHAANKLATRIRQAIEEYKFAFGQQVTASFGVTEYQLCEDLDQLVKRVDNHLYKSKKSGKNNVWSNELDEEEDIQLQ